MRPNKVASPGSGNRQIAAALLKWYRRHYRPLPWRETRDPYRIWVSEIMLQQTRVAAVIPYYDRVLQLFPDVEALANAPESELLACWSGLGYYRRVRQMQAAARQIVEEWSGSFPTTHDGLLRLPGIGAYTAAAIASISFNGRHAVVDGNVIRVMTRLFDESGDVGHGDTQVRIREWAQNLIEAAPARKPGEFNQAVMELGAMLCVPRKPQCLICPLRAFCQARKKGVELARPVKRKKERVERLEMAVAVVRRGSSLLLRQRPPDVSLMPGFWELPETAGAKLGTQCFRALGIECMQKLGEFRHGITFREYRGAVYHAESESKTVAGFRWVSSQELPSLPLTTTTKKALEIAQTAPSAGRKLAKSPKLFSPA
jgi:A/G-specific adenine glycosylase